MRPRWSSLSAMTPPAGGPPPSAAHSEAEVRCRGRLRASLLIGLCCLVVYNANRRSISAGDTYPARYLPFAICSTTPSFSTRRDGRRSGARRQAFWMLLARRPHPSRCTPWCCRCSLRRSTFPRSVICTCGVGRMRGWTTSQGSWRSSPPRSWRRSPRRSSTCCCGGGQSRDRAAAHRRVCLRHHHVGDQQPGLVATRDGSGSW